MNVFWTSGFTNAAAPEGRCQAVVSRSFETSVGLCTDVAGSDNYLTASCDSGVNILGISVLQVGSYRLQRQLMANRSCAGRGQYSRNKVVPAHPSSEQGSARLERRGLPRAAVPAGRARDAYQSVSELEWLVPNAALRTRPLQGPELSRAKTRSGGRAFTLPVYSTRTKNEYCRLPPSANAFILGNGRFITTNHLAQNWSLSAHWT
jgi:hypothetical protein